MTDPPHQVHRSTLAEHPDIRGILPRFVARLPRHVRHLRQLQAAGDAAGIQLLAHQLRGVGRSYGFAPMTDLAGELEERMLARASPAATAEAVKQLIDYMEHVEGFGMAAHE